MRNRSGFTLIELVMIIVILGILAAVAIPKYYDLTSEAKAASESGVVGGVRAGIHTYFVQNRTWPSSLDASSNGNCSKTNPCFNTVLAQGGITSDWVKNSSTLYTGPNGGSYSYNTSDGSLVQQ